MFKLYRGEEFVARFGTRAALESWIAMTDPERNFDYQYVEV
jgi:hypothetical protein